MELEFEKFLNKYFGTLNESLEFSYDVKKLASELRRKFTNKIHSLKTDLFPSSTYESKKAKTGTPTTIDLVVKDFDRSDSEKLNEILNFFGYYISKEDKEDRFIGFQIEPKHGVIFEPGLWKVSKMYHITSSENTSNILNNGLLYRASQTQYDHPGDRIFLFWTKSPDVLYSWTKKLGQSKGATEMSILEVTLKPYYRLYLDDTATLNNIQTDYCSLLAVYTTSAINPINIKLLKNVAV